MKKILLITYYWPPAGGAGVQRWLKLTKCLAKLGTEVHVLTVDPQKASYFQLDKSLKEDIHPNVVVHTTNSFEPLTIYGKIIGKSKVPIAGFSNVDEQKWSQRLMAKIRSRLFIPDPRISWKRYAVKKALAIIDKEHISTVITTSPPHSVQLIGLDIKRKLRDRIYWITDFRDPWTDIYFYPLLRNSKRSHQKNLELERMVLEQADRIVTVGKRFKESLLSKSESVDSTKISIISNAFDPDDFSKVNSIQSNKNYFLISYVGTMANSYQPEVFFEALGKLIKFNSDVPIRFHLTGLVSEQLKEMIVNHIGDNAIFSDTVPHEEAILAMKDAHLLLLITQGDKGTILGKTFEYIAAHRSVICIGNGDSGKLIEECEIGNYFRRSEFDKIYEYLTIKLNEYIKDKPLQFNIEEVNKNSWSHKANLYKNEIP